MTPIEQMQQDLLSFGSGPTLAEMPRSTLEAKGLDGPTAAHRIEEIHTPVNFAYLTCTTGSSAFQNIVGVTWQELPERIEAGKRALTFAGILPGSKVLITYPPLVSVFSNQCLEQAGVSVCFIPRPAVMPCLWLWLPKSQTPSSVNRPFCAQPLRMRNGSVSWMICPKT